ncbi:MAG: NfeD family protein [Candidatus Methanoplasma sp.]|jgi:membrane protein implicated in regulation of membrane protease activity|nr:NfeD family protein [Candidatus Methanoplasma sp.]
MEIETVAIICIVVGLVLLIIEAISPGFFAIIPGAVLVIIGVLGYFVDDFFDSWLLIAAMAIVTLVVSIVTIKVYQLLAKPEPPTTTVTESLVGRTGIVTVKVEPGNIRGKIKIDNDVWSATSDAAINAGETATVLEGTGVHVKVELKG